MKSTLSLGEWENIQNILQKVQQIKFLTYKTNKQDWLLEGIKVFWGLNVLLNYNLHLYEMQEAKKL